MKTSLRLFLVLPALTNPDARHLLIRRPRTGTVLAFESLPGLFVRLDRAGRAGGYQPGNPGQRA